jgi:hypothetical protein
MGSGIPFLVWREAARAEGKKGHPSGIRTKKKHDEGNNYAGNTRVGKDSKSRQGRAFLAKQSNIPKWPQKGEDKGNMSQSQGFFPPKRAYPWGKAGHGPKKSG